jgi:hypothetical protein
VALWFITLTLTLEMRTLLADALSKAHPGLAFPPRTLGASRMEPRRATPRTRGHSDAPITPLDPDPSQQNEASHGRVASGLSIGIGKAGRSSTQELTLALALALALALTRTLTLSPTLTPTPTLTLTRGSPARRRR